MCYSQVRSAKSPRKPAIVFLPTSGSSDSRWKMPPSWDWGGLNLDLSSVMSSLFCHHLHGCRYKMLTKAFKRLKKRPGEGRGGEEERDSGRKKMRLLILWKTSKAKSHFCALLFTFPVFFFSFLESERAREKSHRKHSDHEKHQRLGKLSGGTRKART